MKDPNIDLDALQSVTATAVPGSSHPHRAAAAPVLTTEFILNIPAIEVVTAILLLQT